MNEEPVFFIPEIERDKEEAAYAELAAWCGRPVPSSGRRIYSIAYEHDSEDWIATVGEMLTGMRTKTVRSRGAKREQMTPLHDPATVLAIFANAPYMVVTDSGAKSGGRSSWANPFMAGVPRSVLYFSERPPVHTT